MALTPQVRGALLQFLDSIAYDIARKVVLLSQPSLQFPKLWGGNCTAYWILGEMERDIGPETE